MDLSHPHRVLAPAGRELDVLKVLAGTEEPLTGRKVARLSGTSSRGAWLILERLAEQGLIHRQEAGNATLYTLNQGHLATPAVEILASLRIELLRRLRSSLAEWPIRPVHASLFGSAARGDGGVNSDIDLLLVLPATADNEDAYRDEVSRLSDDVFSWTGNRLSVIELTEEDVPQLREREPEVLQSIRDDGIDLVGVPIRKLFPSP